MTIVLHYSYRTNNTAISYKFTGYSNIFDVCWWMFCYFLLFLVVSIGPKRLVSIKLKTRWKQNWKEIFSKIEIEGKLLSVVLLNKKFWREKEENDSKLNIEINCFIFIVFEIPYFNFRIINLIPIKREHLILLFKLVYSNLHHSH